MPQAEGSAQSLRLMEYLGRLVEGNHARAHELQAGGLRQDRYPVDAWVVWQFGHDVRSHSVQGNGAVSGAHFGFDTVAFRARLQALKQDAENNRDIRVPFMQTVTVAAAGALKYSHQAQRVKDYGAHSVHRHCDGCGGTGRLACSGCHGSGKQSCTGCGGRGCRTVSVQRTRWNGRSHESYYDNESQTCYACYGSGQRVCASCGGSGDQRCGSCAGYGYFTDIAETQAVVRPQWWVRAEGGLAHELLEEFLKERGAPETLDLVPSMHLLDTKYDDKDRWVAHYGGEADVIEQEVALRDRSWTVPAVGPRPMPMQRPPLFDYLLMAEIAHARGLRSKRKPGQVSARMARQLFRDYRSLPALDQAIQNVAALAGARSAHGHAVNQAMQGFISKDAADDLGGVIHRMLHKISPPYSVLAWLVVMAAPIGWVLLITATDTPHVTGWFDGVLGFVGVVLGGCLGVLLLSPIAWLLSALVSALHRLRVPKPYRQKGRNWTPLRSSLGAVLLAALPGMLYGLSVKYLSAPPIDPVVQAAAAWIPGHILPPPAAPAVSIVVPQDPSSTYRAIQHYLNEHGYPVGPEDGLPGARTQAQIKRYLHRQHLSETLPPGAVLANMRQRP